MKLLAVRSLLAVLPLTLIPAFSAPAQEKPKPPADKSGVPEERGSLFVRPEPPELDEFKRHIPP